MKMILHPTKHTLSCAYFANFMASSANELQLRFVHNVFLGCPVNYNGYCYLDPVSGCVYVSCQVYFHENQYAFRT